MNFGRNRIIIILLTPIDEIRHTLEGHVHGRITKLQDL